MLEVRGLRKVYQPLSGPPLAALDEISFEVEDGAFVSIVGPSGCGKSTLLQCVAGLLRPSAGAVLLDGREVTGPPEGMILLFQEYNKSLMAWRSVLENVRFGLEHRPVLTRPEMEAAARQAIEFALRLVQDPRRLALTRWAQALNDIGITAEGLDDDYGLSYVRALAEIEAGVARSGTPPEDSTTTSSDA